MMMWWRFGLPFLVSWGVATVLTPVVIRLYQKLGWLDDPKKSDHPKVVHTYPVPRGGGIPIGIAVVMSSLVFLGMDRHVIGILAGVVVVVVMGMVDDRLNLNPYWRLGLGVAAAGIVVASGIGINFVTNPFGGVIELSRGVADIFAIVWIVWLMNIVNWSKGVDGQLPGIVVIAAVTIAILAERFSADVTQWPVTVLAMVVAGAYAGFLVFNVYPQKIMPGYGGGALGGYLLAVLAILSTAKVGTALVVLGVPMVDAVYVVVRRVWAGKSPVWGDRSHLHHQLLDLGWGKRRVAVFYWGVTAVLGLVALRLNAQQKFYTIVTVMVLVGGFLLWIKHWSFWRVQPGRDKP
ncbi:MAG: undecaprenyl/decaprenyl-phosphate alpha-N-acetylglucosaminyl 1-phosphate transferase [Candidatus Chisholmbacteria bacterium]|nr:undecaprenyl/decaprenyl-phosphate alpha-N-acetylglucosaminyl 1-phosphate transferase [Candidatus Chisholmbacteria bacterium]